MDPHGLEWEGSKHVLELISEWEMDTCSPTTSPFWKESELPERHRNMDPNKAREFRHAATKINYLAQGRIGLSVAANLLSRKMATPYEGDEVAVKRAIRYLKGMTTLVATFA